MNKFIKYILFFSLLIVACKPEHPDLKMAHDIFQEAQSLKQSIITASADLNNQAKMVDSKIRNEDKESVFAISEVYNHLEEVEEGLSKLKGMERAIPGYEKESEGMAVMEANSVPADVLMYQKNYRDQLQTIKIDLDAAATLLSQLKTKFN